MLCPALIISALFRKQRSECVSPSADLGLRCTQQGIRMLQLIAAHWDYGILSLFSLGRVITALCGGQRGNL